MLGNVQAQSNYEMDRYDKAPYGNSYEPDYGNDNRYDSYEPDYGNDNRYDSYEPDYGNDNRYDSYEPEYTDKAYNNYKPDHYGMDNDYYDKKPYGYEPKYSSYEKDDKSKKDDSSKVEINKIKCINTNININGNNAGNVSLGNKGTTEEQGYLGTYSSGGYYDGNNNKQGKGFDCTINNNNNNTNIGGGANQTIPPDDGDQRTNLTVTKTVECVDENEPGLAPDCDALEGTITPSDFTIQVTGNNPVPSSFAGLLTGTQVAIGPGAYTVTETPSAQVTALLTSGDITLETTFAGGCAPSGSGIIEAGVSETCNIINTFTIEEADDVRATLNVTKLVTCQQADSMGGLVPSIQQLSLDCDDLLNIITEDQFNITVTDTNVSPSNFNGSEIGTLVTLDAGPFTVTEEPYDSVAEDVESIEDIQTNVTGPFPSFSEDCTQTGTGSFSAKGDIAAGGQETCNIVNNFVIEEDTPCDACFARLDTNTQDAINDLLETIPDGGIFLSTPRITIPVEVNSSEKLCEFFANIPTITVTSTQRVALVSEFAHSSIGQIPIADAIIRCLEEVGKIIVADTPPV